MVCVRLGGGCVVTRYIVEMYVPDDVDPSTLLEECQELAIKLAEDNLYGDLTERNKEAIRAEISVQAVRS